MLDPLRSNSYWIVWLCLVLAGCGRKSSTTGAAPQVTSAKPPSAATSAPANASSSAAPSEVATPPPNWNGKWPLPQMADAEKCTTSSGEPGLTVNKKDCYNPCMAGMAPANPSRCALKCSSDADCTKGGKLGRCESGVCDRPIGLTCPAKKPPLSCTTDRGEAGLRCNPDARCVGKDEQCPAGLTMYGGTNCAKPCKKNADCPNGSCSEDVCGPLCPSEGCPYLWE